ncbi:hypothetical protein As57867_020675, partial [Aphanomyces stellatus]
MLEQSLDQCTDHSNSLPSSASVDRNNSLTYDLISPGSVNAISISVSHGDDVQVNDGGSGTTTATASSTGTCARVGAAVGVAIFVLIALTLSLKSPLQATTGPSMPTTSPPSTTIQQTTFAPLANMSTGPNVTGRINDNFTRTDDSTPPESTTVQQDTLVTDEPMLEVTSSPPPTSGPILPPIRWSTLKPPSTSSNAPSSTADGGPAVSPASSAPATSNISSPSIMTAPPSPATDSSSSPPAITSLPSEPSTEKNGATLPSPSDGTIGYRVQNNCGRPLTILSIVNNATNEADVVHREDVLVTGGFLDLAHATSVVLRSDATFPLTFEATVADDTNHYRLRADDSFVVGSSQGSVSVTILTNGVQNESCQTIYCRDAQ